MPCSLVDFLKESAALFFGHTSSEWDTHFSWNMKSVCHTVQHHIKLPEASWLALKFSRPISMFLDLIFPPVSTDLYIILVLWFTLKIYPGTIVCNRMEQNFCCNGTQYYLLVLLFMQHESKINVCW